MAALNAIAREYADEIRDGIAWVIVWKTGRSWNAEAFWLNCDDDTFELGIWIGLVKYWSRIRTPSC